MQRPGLTMVETVVAVTIFAVIGGAIYAGLGGYRDRQRVMDSTVILRDVVRALNRYDTLTANGAFPPAAGRYPRRLSDLTNEITSTVTTGCTNCRNSCDGGYSATNVSGWVNRGPFLGREVVLHTGFRIPIGLVRDSLIRTPATAANADRSFARLQIRIDSVFYSDAVELNAVVDGDLPTDTTGIVRWTATPDADGRLASVFWNIPVGGC